MVHLGLGPFLLEVAEIFPLFLMIFFSQFDRTASFTYSTYIYVYKVKRGGLYEGFLFR